MRRTVAWFNCFAGIAGDMALGSLVDAGADAAEVMAILERLPIGGWSLELEATLRSGLKCTQAQVHVVGDSVVRTWMHIQGVLEEARLPERVRERSIQAFVALAEAEGHVHRRAPSHVHFHEVGGHDTIVDIVGSAAALEVLGVDEVTASAIAIGTGTVHSAHGILPNPPPAVVELLTGIPTVGRSLPLELTTPTGAAIVRGWGSSFGQMPAMTIDRAGYGAGSREIDGMANCTQVVIGQAEPSALASQPLVVIETNVDDATGETLAHALDALMSAGALDAWITPVLMKKGRPAHLVSALCDVALTGQLVDTMRAETGSLGIRAHEVSRSASIRRSDEVDVDGQLVRVKVSPGRVKAEHADTARAARRLGRPLVEVAARAEAAWWQQQGERRAEEPEPEPPAPA